MNDSHTWARIYRKMICFSLKVQMMMAIIEFVSQFTCLQSHVYVKYKR